MQQDPEGYYNAQNGDATETDMTIKNCKYKRAGVMKKSSYKQ